MTDCLGHMAGLKTRYADWIAPAVQETRTADEIIGDIRAKLTHLGGD